MQMETSTLLIDDSDCFKVDSDHPTKLDARLFAADFTETIISMTSLNAQAD